MKATVFKDDFIKMNREISPDSFSIWGLEALFNWFEQFEEDTGEEIEIDPVAIRCEWNECKNWDDFKRNWGYNVTSMDELEETTTVVPTNYLGGFLFVAF